jgi:hypothetical protein
MVKVIKIKDEYNDKVNFVDSNNLFIGYDLRQHCCEYAYWFICDREITIDELRDFSDKKIEEFILNNQKTEYFCYYFDEEYYKYIEDADNETCKSNINIAIFRLINDRDDREDKCKYLHLVNCQNGYYGHGFICFNDCYELIADGLL